MEILVQGTWRIHPHVDASVDALLTLRQPDTQLRMHQDGRFIVNIETAAPSLLQSSRASDVEADSEWLANLGKLANQIEHAGS